MTKTLALVIALFTTPALALAQAPQQPQPQQPDPSQQRLKSFDTMQAQRNQAMDAVAYCVGEMQSQIETLKKQLEEARKACPAKVEEPAK